MNKRELVKVCKLPFSTGKSTDYKANDCLLFKLQDGKISLNNVVLKALKFELQMPIQFFIKNGDTIIIRKHQFNFSHSEGMSFTGQSGIINKNKYLNIPKKLRDKLGIKDGDTLKAKIFENTLIINSIQY
ncbi:AbrB/MazE/SpoVT family DNA-binding domain-containing protein [Priestia megaterium]